MKFLEEICFYLTRSWIDIFVIVKTNVFGIDGGRLRLGLSWFNWLVSFAPEFLCCYFCESSCLFYLSFNFDFYVSKIMHL